MELHLSDDDVDRIVAALAPLIAQRLPEPQRSAPVWIDTRAAAAHAGCTISSLHKAMAAREVRFEQKVDGGKAWFRREWIDAWREGHQP